MCGYKINIFKNLNKVYGKNKVLKQRINLGKKNVILNKFRNNGSGWYGQ